MAAKHRVSAFETAVNTSLYAASATSLLPTLSKADTRHFSFLFTPPTLLADFHSQNVLNCDSKASLPVRRCETF